MAKDDKTAESVTTDQVKAMVATAVDGLRKYVDGELSSLRDVVGQHFTDSGRVLNEVGSALREFVTRGELREMQRRLEAFGLRVGVIEEAAPPAPPPVDERGQVWNGQRWVAPAKKDVEK